MANTAVTRPVLFYDDTCRLCRAAAALVKIWDRAGRVGILPFSDPRSSGALAGLPAEDRFASMHLVWPDGGVTSEGTALIELGKQLPGLRSSARLAQRSDRVRRAVEVAYSAVSSRRAWLSRLVPDVAPTRVTPSESPNWFRVCRYGGPEGR